MAADVTGLLVSQLGLLLLGLRLLGAVSRVAGDVALTRFQVEQMWRWYCREHGINGPPEAKRDD